MPCRMAVSGRIWAGINRGGKSDRGYREFELRVIEKSFRIRKVRETIKEGVENGRKKDVGEKASKKNLGDWKKGVNELKGGRFGGDERKFCGIRGLEIAPWSPNG